MNHSCNSQLRLGAVLAAAALFAAPAQAYVGPGAGLSLLGALWALVAAIAAAVGFILMWPIRKAMKQRKAAAKAGDSEAAAGDRRTP